MQAQQRQQKQAQQLQQVQKSPPSEKGGVNQERGGYPAPAKFKDVRVVGTSHALRLAKNAGIPSNFNWKPSKNSNGVIYQNQTNEHESIRYMPGNPNSPNIAQKVPYVVHMKDGKALDIRP